jgi:hypothetical protein
MRMSPTQQIVDVDPTMPALWLFGIGFILLNFYPSIVFYLHQLLLHFY